MSLSLIENYFTDFSAEQKEQLRALYPLYKEWNEKINVVSRKDIDALYEKHILHSLAIAAVFHFEKGTKIVDLGTGGGFPGIPLAIFFPEVEFLLTDSIGKKLKVIEAVASAIGLKNVKVRHTRTEEIKDQKFDFVVSRAVAPLRELWHWSLPILKAKGQGMPASIDEEKIYGGLICLKGGDLTEEIKTSGLNPYIWKIEELFQEPFFKEKYVLLVKR
ncbi:MAG: 16S rRNA (guanine(527)-N(7))-methyltransferase RsmG [Bacteroidota bacterium]